LLIHIHCEVIPADLELSSYEAIIKPRSFDSIKDIQKLLNVTEREGAKAFIVEREEIEQKKRQLNLFKQETA